MLDEEKRRTGGTGARGDQYPAAMRAAGRQPVGLYYEPVGESEEKLRLMRLIDEQYTRTPFYGSRRMTAWLRETRLRGEPQARRRLMEVLGLEAIYPKPKLSQRGEGHKIYPYLLKGVEVERVNQVWSTDITYIRMARGFVYLVAVMDWYSRFVLSWALSVTMEPGLLPRGVGSGRCGRGRPEIFNSDQGSQFTSERFTGELEERGIAISMDGRGRCFDNIFIERLWRSLKYEEVYLKDYQLMPEARAGIGAGFSSTTTSGRIRAWTTGHRRDLPGMRESKDKGRRHCLTWGRCPQTPGIYRFGAGMMDYNDELERRIGLRRDAPERRLKRRNGGGGSGRPREIRPAGP